MSVVTVAELRLGVLAAGDGPTRAQRLETLSAAASLAPLPIDEGVVDGRYELQEQFAAGGMATVWRAWDARLHRTVAVKQLSQHLATDPAFVARFQREARHAASLSHPNIVTVFDFGIDNGSAYLVMELVEGESLAQRLRRQPWMDVDSTVAILIGILAGLQEAHQHGIVHRDIKPSNVLLGRSKTVKVADFGIARASGERTALTDTGVLMGTVGYLSPEQCAGQAATPASDLYAVGCLAFECLTGRPPFTGETPASVMYQHQYVQAPSTLLPAHMSVNVPATVAASGAQLTLYALSTDYLSLIGPAGWSCSGSVGADGSSSLQVVPPSEASLLSADKATFRSATVFPVALTADSTSACVGCAYTQACGLFPVATAQYATTYPSCTSTPPSEEKVTTLSQTVVAFEDPPVVAGTGRPSGGSNPANGIVTYSPGGSGQPTANFKATCTLLASSHAICTAALNNFLVRFWES